MKKIKKSIKNSVKSKQILSLSLSAALFLTGCGGGGASSISGATRPQPPLSPSTPSPPSVPATTYSLATKSSSLYSANTNGTDNYNDENKKTSIGIMDGYFSEVKNTVAKNITMLNPVIQPNGGGEGHGSRVATIVARNNPTAQLYGYDAGNPTSDKSVTWLPSDYQELVDKGAKVINNSLGSDPNADLSAVKDYPQYYKPLSDMAKNGNIFVFAAGNESHHFANDQSSLPILYPEAKVGWISVTSINEKDKFAQNYANQLGRAKNWGIAAQGTHSGFLQDKYGLTTGEGTSFAAPVVSAAVAKIWDKFPWMDNHLVTQTLLSTADKYDTKENKIKKDEVTTEPNDMVGWGVLNETRALKGPARFDKKLLLSGAEQVEVKLDYRAYQNKDKLTFSNDIAGDAGLKKSGTGTLYLSGTNSYTGKTTIEGGSLELTGGKLQNTEVEIKNGAKLTVNGKDIQAGKKIDNNGGIFEVFGEGTTITDSYSSSSSAKLVLDITKASLKVTSKLDLANTTFIADVRTMDGINGGQNSKQIVSANDISGFSQYQLSTNANAWLNLSEFKYNNKEFLVSYSRNSSAKALQNLSFVNANTLNTAKNFDNLLKDLENSNEATPIYQAALSVLNSPAPKAAISSLSGEIHAANNALLARQNTMLNHALSQRINTLREQGQNGVLG